MAGSWTFAFKVEHRAVLHFDGLLPAASRSSGSGHKVRLEHVLERYEHARRTVEQLRVDYTRSHICVNTEAHHVVVPSGTTTFEHDHAQTFGSTDERGRVRRQP